MALPLVIIDLKLGPNGLIDIVRTRAVTISHRYSFPEYAVKLPILLRVAAWQTSKLIVYRRTRIVVRSRIESGIIPVAFTFKQVKGDGDPDGTRNFPLSARSVRKAGSNYVLECEDRHLDQGPAGAVRWKCCIVVQNESGAIGIIDPHIENQD